MKSTKKRILIIDDEASFARLLKLNLDHTERYQAEVITDSLRALNAALDFAPDLILLDVMMPGMDGGDVMAGLKAHPRLRDIPVVFLTAAVRSEEVSAKNGIFGGLDFLAKPVELPHLLEYLDKRLRLATPAWADA